MSRGGARLVAAAAVVLALVAAAPAAASPRICLPPIFEGGRRLHQLPAPSVFWLPLLLRQHELCWIEPDPSQLRVGLLGSSPIYGHPLPVEETVGALLNDRFATSGVDAHVFNLAMVFPYQLRDALILHEAVSYDLDVIVYPITLNEFIHVAPALWPQQLFEFFRSNRDIMTPLVEEPLPGLAEPLQSYGDLVAQWNQEAGDLDRLREVEALAGLQDRLDLTVTLAHGVDRLREIGTYARVGARLHAEQIAHRLAPSAPRKKMQTRKRQTSYDCAATKANFATQFADWKEWNILAYLEELQERVGVEVIVVNAPIAHEPVDDCYNVRYSAAAQQEFNRWLRAQTAVRGLRYLDLHDELRPEDFFDSLHFRPAGHQRLADRLGDYLDPLISDLRRRGSN